MQNDEEYFQDLALQYIQKLERDKGMNVNQELNIGINPEQTIEQALIGQILNPSEIKTSGKYLIDSHGNEVALYEKIEGCRVNQNGVNEVIEKEYYRTMDDGTSMGDFVECRNCGAIIHKQNSFQCSCGNACCILCGIPSKKIEGKCYCRKWHRTLAEGLF